MDENAKKRAGVLPGDPWSGMRKMPGPVTATAAGNGHHPVAEHDTDQEIRIEPKMYPISDRTPKDVLWLWRGRIPLGAPTILDGDPGTSKTTISIDIAARVTKGIAMPDGDKNDLGKPAGVLFLGLEDDVDNTILPRFMAAGGDQSKFHLLE